MTLLSTAAALRSYYFFAFAAMGLYLPFFPTWVRARGFVGWQMSALVALLPLCQLGAPALVGMVADRFALRGRMMTFCAFITASGLSLLALSSSRLSPLPFGLAWGLMLLFALLRSPMIGLAEVLALEVAPDYGRMRLWGSLGFMVAALLGGRFIDPLHEFALPLVVASIIWLLMVVSLLLPKTSRMPARPALSDARHLLKQTAFRRLLLTMMLIFGSLSAYDLCSTLRLRELNATGNTIGYFWAIATSAEVALLFWAKRFVDGIGPGKLLTFSCLVGAGRWIFLSQATSIPLILWLQPLHAISFGLMWVSAVGVLSRELGEKGTATAQGLFSSAIALGGFVGVSTWGVVYDKYGSEVLFLLAAGVAFLASVGASRLIRFTPPLVRSISLPK